VLAFLSQIGDTRQYNNTHLFMISMFGLLLGLLVDSEGSRGKPSENRLEEWMAQYEN
jgi:hypothetical protein